MADELSWACHVCGDVRPDDKISVLTTEMVYGEGNIPMKQNVRYCNDRPNCVEGAKEINFLPEDAKPV